MLTYVDLFAGCGGLSLGLESVGLELTLAVEKSPMAAQTLYRNVVSPGASHAEWQNHLTREVGEQAKQGLVVGPLRSLLDDQPTMGALGDVDIVVGGPPCQGFSLAGRRNPSDPRNSLAWEFLEFVERTSPKAVVIENVVGMNRRFEGSDDSVFTQLREALASRGVGYVVQGVMANAMHYGAPQHRPRLLLVAVRSDVARDRGLGASSAIWRSEFTDSKRLLRADLAPQPLISSKLVRTLDDAIGDLQSVPRRSSVPAGESYRATLTQFENRLPLNETAIPNQRPRRHSERVKSRFRLYQWLHCENRPRTAMQLAAESGMAAAMAVASTVADESFPAEAPDGTVLARNRAELANLFLELRTRKHSQRVLTWTKPSHTVVTLPDDYVHPTEPRILTVRESARLQGFPDRFRFYGNETTGAERRKFQVPQYSQVGNAVSPFVGRALGNMLNSVLGDATT